MKLNVFQKKKYKVLISRVAIALVAVSLGGILILLDTGVTKKEEEEKTPLSVTEETEKEMMDWASFAKDSLNVLALYSDLKNGEELITKAPFDAETMSLVKQKLNAGSYSLLMDVLIKEEGKKNTYFATPTLTEIPESENFIPTNFRDTEGRGIYQKKDTDEYFYLDFETLTFVPATFNLNINGHKIERPLPETYGKADENTTLIFENGLYGYEGSYKDGKKSKTFTVEPSYTTAFHYHEGFAVMADENGKITIRNEKGEEVFTELSLILPDKTGEDLLGFHYFDSGLLRVVIAGYDTEGNLVSKRESIINTKGQEITIPEGFYVRNLFDGIITVTNGKTYGYLSAAGAWITAPTYQALEPFSAGLAVVTGEEGKMGLMDQNGKIILPCAFDIITTFSDSHALCYSHSTGWYLLTKVEGKFNKGETPQGSTYYTKITITRGPQNTFDYQPDEIIELPPVVTTVSRTTRPENTLSSEKETDTKENTPTSSSKTEKTPDSSSTKAPDSSSTKAPETSTKTEKATETTTKKEN